MKMHDEWRWIVRKAWSIRFIVLAFAMSAVEAILPYYFDAFPRGVFALLTCFFTGGAFVARLVAQQNIGAKNAD